jgi:hypothetical protein
MAQRFGYNLAIALLVAAAGGVLAAVADDSANQPRIEFETVEHDFGVIRGTTPWKCEFRFRNTGDAELLITNVQSSCGCTVAAPDKKNFAPGESGVITAAVDPTKISGLFSRTVTVFTNAPQSGQVILTVKGNSVREVSWSPSNHIVFGNIASTAVTSRSVDVSFNTEAPIRVVEATSQSPNLKVEITEVAAGKHYRVQVTTVPPLPAGPFSGKISIHTDHGQYKTLECVAAAVVVAPITAYPPEAVVQEQGGYLIAPAIVVRHNDGGKFQIKKAEIQPEGFQFRIEPLQDGKAYRVLLISAPAGWQPKGDGLLLVQTDDKEVPEVRVPLHFK